MKATAVRRRAIVSVLFALVVALTTAGTAQSQTAGSAEELIKDAQQRLVQAAIKGDKDEAARYLADDVTWVGNDGKVLDKQGRLASLPVSVRSVETDQVKVVGTTAISTGTASFENGSTERFLKQWVNRDGQWKVLVQQGTPIAAAGAGAMAMASTGQPTGTSGIRAAAVEPRTVAPTLSSADERAVWKAQVAIVELYAKGDVKRYSQLTADDFRRIDTDGKVYTKAGWLDNVRKQVKQPTKPGALSEVQIHLDGDLAVATMQLIAYNPDGSTQPPERQTRIFERRNGQWQQVAAIGTQISQ